MCPDEAAQAKPFPECSSAIPFLSGGKSADWSYGQGGGGAVGWSGVVCFDTSICRRFGQTREDQTLGSLDRLENPGGPRNGGKVIAVLD